MTNVHRRVVRQLAGHVARSVQNQQAQTRVEQLGARPPPAAPQTHAIQTPNGTFELVYGDTPATGRRCGSCSLCCKLVPVATLHKPSFTRCIHQRFSPSGGGCKIYARRPGACERWSCMWLIEPRLQTNRPDRTHYVLDVLPDVIRTTDNDTGQRKEVTVLQVWVDPGHPNAHHDPALRAFLADRAQEHGTPALVRVGQRKAFLLVAPVLSKTGGWLEMETVFGPNVGLWS